ncbi:MAG: DUF4984 domain-containing protein, partial [Alistipes sp.]|nr:DUF4984 domain-containing protein [Alistipes sp.]
KRYINTTSFIVALGALLLTAMVGCEPERPTYDGPNYVMFSAERHDLGILDSEEWFEIPISATRTAEYDRNVGVEIIAARSSAIYGLHYTVESTTVTIPAGKLTTALRIKGNPDEIGVSDSLGVTLRLAINEEDEWEDYNVETEVYLHKCCPFDINYFTGYAVLTSTWVMQYMNAESLLVHTHLDENTPNTIIVEDMFYKGYDISITLNNDNRLEPLIEMPQEQVVGSTGEAFGTIYGNGKLMMTQTIGASSYYSSCEGFLLLYVTIYVDGVGTVGTYANVLEWITDEEAERIMREGF